MQTENCNIHSYKYWRYSTHHESLIKVAALSRGLIVHWIDVTSTVIVLSLSSRIPGRRRYRSRLVSINPSRGLLRYGSVPERIPRLISSSLLYAPDKTAGLPGLIASRFFLSGRRRCCRSKDSPGRNLLTSRRVSGLVSGRRVLSRVGGFVARRGHYGRLIARGREVVPPGDSSGVNSSGRDLLPTSYGSRVELVARDVVVDTLDLVGSEYWEIIIYR